MIDWVPVVFVIFKVLIFGTVMFLAIRWHYEQGKKGRQKERRAVLYAAGKAAGIFALLLVGLLLITYFVSRELGLDLTFP